MKKLKKKTRIRLITKDVFAALAVVVAKAPYFHESDNSTLVLLQTRMIKCEKVSGFVGKIVFTTNIPNLRSIGFTLSFWSKISRDLTKLALFYFGYSHLVKNDTRNPVTKLSTFPTNPDSGKVRSLIV